MRAGFLLAFAFLTICPGPILRPALAQTTLIVTFTAQDVSPETIKMESLGEKLINKEIKKFSATNNKIILTPQDFAEPIEKFSVTVSYKADKLEFELRLMIPLSNGEEKQVFLIKPVKERIHDTTQEAIEAFQDDIQIASGPYFTCRQNYFAAKGQNDPVLEINAAFCWLFANSRLVFANPKGPKGRFYRKLYNPDERAIEVVEKILEDKKRRDSLNRSRYANDEKKAADEIARLKLSHWLFFADRNDLQAVHGWSHHCKINALFRNELSTLTPDQKARLAQAPFIVSQPTLDKFEATATPASAGQSCDTPGQRS